MIKHQLFAKGDTIHALISTTQNPNILFPVRATIYDVKFNDINPQYQIRIKNLYDNIYYLKHYMFGGRFIKDFNNKDTKINVKREGYTTVKQVEEELFNGNNWKSYLLLVDSVFCTKTRVEQVVLFNKINTFHIQIKLKEIYELTNRSAYSKGQFYFHTKGEYIKSVEKFLGSRLPSNKNWASDLLNRPGANELDGVEWI
jgi:hypothetical protein